MVSSTSAIALTDTAQPHDAARGAYPCVDILDIAWMPPAASLLGAIQGIIAIKTTAHVYLRRDLVEMIWAHARPILAQVINYACSVDSAVKQFVGKTVGTDASRPGITATLVGRSERAIPTTSYAACPNPTGTQFRMTLGDRVMLVNLGPKPFSVSVHTPILSRPAVAGKARR